jgi:hypothetical protein
MAKPHLTIYIHFKKMKDRKLKHVLWQGGYQCGGGK